MSPDGGIKHPNVPAELFDRVKDVADGELPDAIDGRSLSFADALELVLDRAERGGRSSGGEVGGSSREPSALEESRGDVLEQLGSGRSS